jgi:hypothetical protein
MGKYKEKEKTSTPQNTEAFIKNVKIKLKKGD